MQCEQDQVEARQCPRDRGSGDGHRSSVPRCGNQQDPTGERQETTQRKELFGSHRATITGIACTLSRRASHTNSDAQRGRRQPRDQRGQRRALRCEHGLAAQRLPQQNRKQRCVAERDDEDRPAPDLRRGAEANQPDECGNRLDRVEPEEVRPREDPRVRGSIPCRGARVLRPPPLPCGRRQPACCESCERARVARRWDASSIPRLRIR